MEDLSKLKETNIDNKILPDVNKIARLKTKRDLLEQRLVVFSFIWWVAVCYVVAGGALGYIYAATAAKTTPSVLPPYIAAGAILGIFIYSFSVVIIRLNLQGRIRWVNVNLSQMGIEELNENIQVEFFTKLVQINFKYIDKYYLQTQEQADKSFRLAVFASVSGLIILIIGILIMYFNIDREKTLAGVLTTSSGILSQFIAAVFFYLYNQTIVKMSQYHQKLVITQNISLALKITADMEGESKKKSLELLIDRLTFDVNKSLIDAK